MEKDNYLDFFKNEQKAIDHAIWLNFKYRIAGIVFGVIHGPERNYGVCEEATLEELEMKFLDILPKDYSELTYRQLDHIAMDDNPLPHWEQIRGMISVVDGEILRYILHNNIPIHRLIRHELASRGFDENHRWCGFENARKIWCK